MTVLTRRLSVALFGLILAVGASTGSTGAEPPPSDTYSRALFPVSNFRNLSKQFLMDN